MTAREVDQRNADFLWSVLTGAGDLIVFCSPEVLVMWWPLASVSLFAAGVAVLLGLLASATAQPLRFSSECKLLKRRICSLFLLPLLVTGASLHIPALHKDSILTILLQAVSLQMALQFTPGL